MENSIFQKTRRFLFIVIPVILCMGAFTSAVSGTAPEGTRRMAIVPFQINAEKDYTFLSSGVQDMLTSRLSQNDRPIAVIDRVKIQAALQNYNLPLTAASGRALGQDLKADYVLHGSLTFFGESVSIDGRLIDVHDPSTEKTFFSQTDDTSDLLLLVNDFARNVADHVFSAPSVATPVRAPSPFVVASEAPPAAEFWKSPEFNVSLKGLAVADVTGDGQNEIIMISDRTILIYRFTSGGFRQFKEIHLNNYQELISADAADINGSGRAEIFISCLHTTSFKLDSFVLEYDGQDFVKRHENQNWYFRVLTGPDQTPILLGQKRGIADLFLGAVQQLTWQDQHYKPSREVRLPARTNIYSFSLANLLSSDSPDIVPDTVLFDTGDHLQIYKGREPRWKSPQRYGGSEKHLLVSKNSADRIYLAHRIIPIATDGGTPQLLVVTHDSLTGKLFDRFRRYDGAVFSALAWDGYNLVPEWQTHKLNGYVSDYAVADVFNDGQPELAALVIERRGGVLQQPVSFLVVYRLAALY